MLQQTLAGLENLHVPLVAIYQGKIVASGVMDDLGIYYFIPKLAQLTGLSLNTVIPYFFTGILLLSLALAFIGYCLLCKTFFGRFISLIVLADVYTIVAPYSDVYVAQAAVPLSIMPLFFYFLHSASSSRLAWSFTLFLFFAGVFIGTGNFVRSFAGTPVLLVMIFMLVFARKFAIKQKGTYLAILIIGAFISHFYYSSLVEARDKYLEAHIANYQVMVERHPLWWSAYIGLGYLDNPYKLKYNDSVAAATVKAINPNVDFISIEGQKILKQQYFKFIEEHPVFFINTVLSKASVLIQMTLLYLLVGLLCAILYPKDWIEEIGILLGIALTAAPGLLVIPNIAYVFGFIVFSIFFMLYGLIAAVNQGLLQDVFNILRGKNILKDKIVTKNTVVTLAKYFLTLVLSVLSVILLYQIIMEIKLF
jgi:hypothetical protein